MLTVAMCASAEPHPAEHPIRKLQSRRSEENLSLRWAARRKTTHTPSSEAVWKEGRRKCCWEGSWAACLNASITTAEVRGGVSTGRHTAHHQQYTTLVWLRRQQNLNSLHHMDVCHLRFQRGVVGCDHISEKVIHGWKNISVSSRIPLSNEGWMF